MIQKCMPTENFLIKMMHGLQNISTCALSMPSVSPSLKKSISNIAGMLLKKSISNIAGMLLKKFISNIAGML